MRLKPGQVIVSEGGRGSLLGSLVAYGSGSWWTHALVVVGDDLAIEAWFPKVRFIKLSERLDRLREERRAFVVLEHPRLDDELRQDLVDSAERFKGRYYDVGQGLIYLFLRRFRKDGPGTLVCSRLVTALYRSIGINLFPPLTVSRAPGRFSTRYKNLLNGYATPAELLYWSTLVPVAAFNPQKEAYKQRLALHRRDVRDQVRRRTRMT